MTQTTSKSDRSIFSLLAAAKNGPTVESEPVEAADYDWNVPCRFTPAQLDKLGQFTARVATEIALKLSVQLHEEMQLTAAPPSQHYAGRLALLESTADRCYFPVTREDGEQCGLVVIPGELARRWVDKALGGSETPGDNEREFSTLESALMRDVVVAVVDALSGEYRAATGSAFKCGRQVSVDEALPDVRNEDEYCVLAFRVGEDQDQTVSFILASDVMVEAASTGIVAQGGDRSPDDSRENMLACVNQASVTATVSLMTIQLSLRQVMNLEIGDVLIASKRVGEPLELCVSGEVVLSGYPVSCDGQYALQIAT